MEGKTCGEKLNSLHALFSHPLSSSFLDTGSLGRQESGQRLRDQYWPAKGNRFTNAAAKNPSCSDKERERLEGNSSRAGRKGASALVFFSPHPSHPARCPLPAALPVQTPNSKSPITIAHPRPQWLPNCITISHPLCTLPFPHPRILSMSWSVMSALSPSSSSPARCPPSQFKIQLQIYLLTSHVPHQYIPTNPQKDLLHSSFIEGPLHPASTILATARGLKSTRWLRSVRLAF